MSEDTLPTVRYRDGIEIDIGGETLVADADEPRGDVNVLSHAHGDHLYGDAPGDVVCSALTARLANVRRDGERIEAGSHPAVELYPAGHIAGSRATLVDAGDARVLYTGDISTRDRFYLDGFEPPSADVLVIETTYGKPAYTFPSQATVERELVDWLNDTDGPVILFGYALGRAQKLQLLVGRSSRDRLFVSDAIAALNDPIAVATDVEFGAERWGRETELGANDALVLPTQLNKLAWVESLVESTDATTVGVSGWAVEDAFKYRGGYDATFPLSDHCDFEELLGVVERVDPERVYTQHGFADEFARHLTRRGYDATTLKRNQTSISDF